MKKILFLTIALYCLLTSLFCQQHLGLKGGLNFSTVKNNNWKPDGKKLGLLLGVVGYINTKGNVFSFQPELLYSNKGFKFSGNTVKENATLYLHYISVPLLTGVRLGKNVQVLLGPEISYLLVANSRHDGVINRVQNTHRRIDAGINAGLVYNVAPNFGIDIRYCYGFNRVQGAFKTSPLIDYIPISKGANRSLQVGIVYKLRLGRATI